MDTPLRLAIDYDDTLMDTKNVPKGYKLGQPIPGAVKAMQQLKSQGAILVIHSVWANTEQKCQAMAEWCQYFDIPYDFITNKKPICDAYIDNLGYRFENWGDTLEFVSKLPQARQNRS